MLPTELAVIVERVIPIDEQDAELIALPNSGDASSTRPPASAKSKNGNRFFTGKGGWNRTLDLAHWHHFETMSFPWRGLNVLPIHGAQDSQSVANSLELLNRALLHRTDRCRYNETKTMVWMRRYAQMKEFPAHQSWGP